MAPNSERQFDVVLFGATGYTGGLALEHFLTRFPDQKEIKWAYAGRSKKKTQEALKTAVANLSLTKFTTPELIIADSGDMASLMAMCECTNVVLSTVGPYCKYGDLLVDACVDCDTDYCDITGETFWIRKMIDKHHDKCVTKGTRIVNATGFDSIPTDLAILMACEEAKKTISKNDRIVSAKYTVGKTQGGPSGGTLATGIEMMRLLAKGHEGVKQMVSDPYSLCPSIDSKNRVDSGYGPALRGATPGCIVPVYDKKLKVYQAVSVMAVSNTAVTRRSFFLNGTKDIVVAETMSFGYFVVACVVQFSLMLGPLFAMIPFLLTLVEKVMPGPGWGISRKQVMAGFFNGTAVVETEQGKTFVCTVHGNRDPGYGATSRMISETAVQLALTRGSAGERKGSGGVTTTGSGRGLGLALVAQLQANAGLSFVAAQTKSDDETAKSLVGPAF